MGRTPKFPPLPAKDQPSQALVTVPMPPRVSEETLAERKRELSLLSRTRVDQHFDDTVDRIFNLPDSTVNFKGDVSYEPLKIKADLLKWLAERGYGKAPQIVKLGTDAGSPQALLEEIAKRRTEEYIAKQEAERLRKEAITVPATEVEGEEA